MTNKGNDSYLPSGSSQTIGNRGGLLLAAFSISALVAIAIPSALLAVAGVYCAAVASIVIAALWFCLVPTTCRSGGYLCSLLAMPIFFNAIAFALFATAYFIRAHVSQISQ